MAPRLSESPRRSSPPSTATARPGRWPTSGQGSCESIRQIKICPYVRKHYPSKNMQTSAARSRRKRGCVLTSASSATVRKATSRPQANDLTQEPRCRARCRLLRSANPIARAYGATVTPHMYLIDATGTGLKAHRLRFPRPTSPTSPRPISNVRSASMKWLAGKPVSAFV